MYYDEGSGIVAEQHLTPESNKVVFTVSPIREDPAMSFTQRDINED